MLRTILPSTHRREIQDYIPAQLYRSLAGSAWLGLLGQHRQQTQALSPHQARAQFLGKSLQLGWISEGHPTMEGVLEAGEGGTFFFAQRHFQC